MSNIFPGVSTDAIEKFFVNMIVSDVSMPHTKMKLSPITFTEFLARNQVLTVAPFQIYDAANKMWRKFFNVNQGLFQASARANYDLDQAEIPHGGWNMVIDYLYRFLEVEKMSAAPYYQMHYIAHVTNNFYRETEQFDQSKCAAYRTIFNDLINQMLYDPIVPTTYSYLPILNYADVRFSSALEIAITKVKSYIQVHAGNKMDFKKFDENRVEILRNEIDNAIRSAHSVKYNNTSELSGIIATFLARIEVYLTDVEMCELHQSLRNDGFQCVQILDFIHTKIKRRYEKHLYDDNADDFIDDLLDIRPKGPSKQQEENKQNESEEASV